MKARFLFFMSVCCLGSMSLSGQISIKTEYFGSSGYYLDKGEKPCERIGNSKGSAMVWQGSVNLPFSVKTDDQERPVIWGAALGASYVSLNNKNFTEEMVIPEIMDIEFGLWHLRPLKGKWSLLASVGVGVYSPSPNLSDIRWRQVLGSGSAVFICQVNPNLQLGGGVAVNSTFGYPMVFPALYLNWQLQGRLGFSLSMANGIEIKTGMDLNHFLSLSLIADMNGQMALLEKEGKNVIFTHQYMVTGLCSEFKINRKISVPLTVGINAQRPASFSDRTLKAMFKTDNDYYFQVSPYVSAGVTVKF